ncbi:hypothetical protein, partial [Streptomyces sp. NPDC020298]|uniref:hypothetical protein n=1 Tax=unclassified Streptomyces TaxID=2593676 RepID=UPI0033FE521C
MPEFEPAELDYEFARESANVVNVERPTSESEKACGKSRRPGIGRRKDLIESETQDRREAPGGKPRESLSGEYKGSDRS